MFENPTLSKACLHLLHGAAAGMGDAIHLRECMASQCLARTPVPVQQGVDAGTCEHSTVWQLDTYRQLMPIISIMQQGIQTPAVSRLLCTLRFSSFSFLFLCLRGAPSCQPRNLSAHVPAWKLNRSLPATITAALGREGSPADRGARNGPRQRGARGRGRAVGSRMARNRRGVQGQRG